MKKPVAIVVIAIGDKPNRAAHTDRHLSVTRPYLAHLAARLGGDLIIYTEKFRKGRQLPAWQKLCIPAHLSQEYSTIICMDFDILPHPHTPLDDLVNIPPGHIAMCAVDNDWQKAQQYYQEVLGLPPTEVSNVRSILNSGMFAWKTQNDEPIRALFDELFMSAKEHYSEQSAFAHAIQQRGMHHLLPERYNTHYVRAKPFPFCWHRPNKMVMSVPALKPIQTITDTLALRKLFAKPCFVHFVGGIYAESLARGARILGDPAAYNEVQVDTPAISAR
jgi:hypothetical protein